MKQHGNCNNYANDDGYPVAKIAYHYKLNSMSFSVLILDIICLCPFVSMILDLVSLSVNDTGFSVF